MFWALVGMSIPGGAKRDYRLLAPILLVTHYVSAVFIVGYTEFGDWSYFWDEWEETPAILVFGAVVYLVGQIAAWGAYLRVVRGGTPAN